MCKVLEDMREETAKAQEQQTKVVDIKNLMKNLKLTLEQAMDALSIPSSERSMYTTLVNKK